jgi:CubicO group peptidase (beta-lactamase class C family)
MDLHTYQKLITLVKRMMDGDKPVEPIIDAASGKPDFRPSAVRQKFASASAESCGIPSAHIENFLHDLDADRSLDMHGVSIYRHGRRICDAAFGAYDRGVWHITYSECKSITALAIGMLVDEGLLDLHERLIDIFERTGLSKLTHAAITVEDLLTMRSGVAMNESAAVTETEWVRCFFESAVKNPGGEFHYNSINTYMLSAIVTQKTGQSLVEYLHPRLFEPLGITNYYWEASPEGITKAGWGLYILPEDLAKIGQLVLDGGAWRGHQLVSRDWIGQMTARQVKTPAHTGRFDYGYQTWVGENEDSFLFNGMFGQNVIGYPATGLLIVSNAGNNELFQQSRFYDLVEDYFSRPFGAALPEDWAAQDSLRRTCETLGRRAAYLEQPTPSRWRRLFHPISTRREQEQLRERIEELNGRRFVLPADKQNALGLMPGFMQAIQNNYSGGLRALSFAAHGDELWCDLREADRVHSFAIGFDIPAYTVLDFGQERHCVGVTGAFSQNEDNVPVLKVRFSFLETAHARTVKFFFEEDGLRLKFDEAPGVGLLHTAVSTATEGDNPSRLLQTVLKSKSSDVIAYLLRRTMQPEIFLPEQ